MVKKWSWLNEGQVEVFSKSAMMTWLVSVDQIRPGTVLCELLSDGGNSEGYTQLPLNHELNSILVQYLL